MTRQPPAAGGRNTTPNWRQAARRKAEPSPAQRRPNTIADGASLGSLFNETLIPQARDSGDLYRSPVFK
jgi:hypothetical protein